MGELAEQTEAACTVQAVSAGAGAAAAAAAASERQQCCHDRYSHHPAARQVRAPRARGAPFPCASRPVPDRAHRCLDLWLQPSASRSGQK